MPVSAGSRLRPYEILALIGAGGMGEVYRVPDSRIGWDVAFKISAEQFSERFDSEVHAVARLFHEQTARSFDRCWEVHGRCGHRVCGLGARSSATVVNRSSESEGRSGVVMCSGSVTTLVAEEKVI